MKIIHPSNSESGHPYNRETAGRLVGRVVWVRSMIRTYRLEVQVPAYVAAKLGSHDWDEISARLALFADQKEAEARLVGAPREMIEVLVGAAAKKTIYDAFTGHQIRAGNEAWATPISLLQDQYPGVVDA